MTRGETANPWRIPAVPKKTRYLTPDEYKLVYDFFDLDRGINGYVLRPHQRIRRQDCRDLLVALAFTGGRWAEIAGLTWEQVDLAGGHIRLWGNKTGRERVVPLADPLREVLVRRKGAETRPRGLIFANPDGMQRAAPSDAIAKAMDAVGLNRPDLVTKYGRATVHSLRHTFASWLVQGGATLNEVQDALGHSSIMSTVRYAHLGRAETLKKLGGVLNGVSALAGDQPTPEDEKR
jgi:integrase